MAAMAANTLPICIAGGGIGGLACGLVLARSGRQVVICERAEVFSETGAGIQIGPNAFAMFDVMGLTDAIRQVAVLPTALVMMDALTGKQITRVQLNDAEFANWFKHPYGVIYRPDLHGLLLAEVKRQANVELRSGCAVKGFRDHGDHVVVTAGNDTIKAHGLIGADGLWSVVRKAVCGDAKPRVSGHIAYRAVLKTSDVPVANKTDEVVLWAGPRTHLVHYPLHCGEIYNLVAVFHSDRYEEGWDVFGDEQELTAKFAGQCPQVLNMLEKIDSWRMWVLCDREPERNWSSNHVTLLGDAAHPTLQYLAQGACMAIEDAVCLAAMCDRHRDDLAAAFRAYQAKRYLRTARVQLTSRLYGDIYHASGATADLRAQLLSGRDATSAYGGMQWLYNGVNKHGEQIL